MNMILMILIQYTQCSFLCKIRDFLIENQKRNGREKSSRLFLQIRLRKIDNYYGIE